VSELLSTSHEAVAWGMSGWATSHLRKNNKGRPFTERPILNAI
jgi:hypothetical protein